jgi:hypothetical protein
MTNKQLSPASQAVLDATRFEVNAECHSPWIAAAALRAAADQVVPENANAVGDEHDDARHDQWMRIRYKILVIAAELEAL